VSCGYWPLYRYNPALAAAGQNPLQLDSKSPTTSFEEYAYGENRYKVLQKINPTAAAVLMKKATAWTGSRFEYYQKLAALTYEKK
jgi:pyruvate-ferredoxin/flavodoxin oxidoreductase